MSVANFGADAPITNLECGYYNCTQNGVYIITKDKTVIICSHPIMVSKRITNIDTGKQKVEIAFKLYKDTPWKKVICDRQVICSAGQIVQLSSDGVDVTTSTAKGLVDYLQYIQQYNSIPCVQSTNRVGWVTDDRFTPVNNIDAIKIISGEDAQQEIIFDGDEAYGKYYDAICSKGKYDSWYASIKPIREGSKVAPKVILIASFASALVHELGTLPFIVHLWGMTGGGKTVSLMLASSVWANPATYYTSFNSTMVGQEELCAFLNSLPLCMDEAQIARNSVDPDKTIYALTEGQGRVRGKRDGGMQDIRHWQNIIITTGEQPLTSDSSGGGAVNRVINLQYTGDLYEMDTLPSFCNAIRKNYGSAGKRFMTHYLQDREVNQSKAMQMYEDTLRRLRTEYKVTDKQAMGAAVLLVADKLADDLVFHDGLTIKEQDLAQALMTVDDVDQNKKAYDFLIDLVESNPDRFGHTHDSFGEYWGQASGEDIKIFKKVLVQKLSGAGYNAVSFLKWASDKGMLKQGANRNDFTTSVKIGGRMFRMVHIMKAS